MKGGCETNFVRGIKDVAKRSQEEGRRKNAAKDTIRRQKLGSNRGGKNHRDRYGGECGKQNVRLHTADAKGGRDRWHTSL